MLSEIGYTIDIVDGVYVLNHFDKVVASGVSGDYILEYVCRETFKYLEQDIDELLNELQKHSVNQSVVINNFAGTDKQALITLIEAHINRN
jgi:hypothetical protein